MPTMPNFVGMTIDDARNARIVAGFAGGVYSAGRHQVSNTNLVTAQTPSAGSSQASNVDITLTLDCTVVELNENVVVWGA